MAGVAGRSGTNKGKDKPFRDALRLEIAAAEDSPRALRKIASKLIDMAAAGDMQAIREIGDRMDGKPAQAVEHSGNIGTAHEDALDDLDDRPGTRNQTTSSDESAELRREVPQDTDQGRLH